MKKNNLSKAFVITNTITILVCAIAILLLVTAPFKEKQEEPVRMYDGFCYWKTIQVGDSIAETEAGIYLYQLYMTTQGIEVWIPCE